MSLEPSLLTNPDSFILHRRSVSALWSVLCLVICIMVHKVERHGKRDWQWRMRQKKWLSTSAFSSSAVTSLPAMLIRGLNLPGITFHLPNGTIPWATKLQSSLWVLHAVLCKRATMRGLLHQRCSNPRTLLCCHLWWKQSKEKGQSWATTETKDTQSYCRNIHTDKVFKQPMILTQLVDFNSISRFFPTM